MNDGANHLDVIVMDAVERVTATGPRQLGFVSL